MPTTVIHVRNADFTDPNTVYIGRAAPRRRLPFSKWANPYKITPRVSRRIVIALYRHHIENNEAMLAALPELRGKTLACWCKPEACHGDVLAEMADSLPSSGPLGVED